MVCRICESLDDGKHFGILVCRPCGAFYRRTIVYKLIYKCKSNGKCSILRELRKTCPACRYEKCRESGMSSELIQLHRDKNGPLKKSHRLDIVQPDEKSPNPTIEVPKITAEIPKNLLSPICSFNTSGFDLCLPGPQDSLLDFLHSGLKNYMDGEKFLHYILYPESVINLTDTIAIESFREMSHDELVCMERGCVPLLQSLVLSWCPMYQQMPIEAKMALMRSFFDVFYSLHCCYLNYIYGDPNDKRKFVIHYGQFVVNETSFYNTDKNPEYSVSISDECVSHCFKLCDRIKSIKFREVELAAISAICLANEVGVVFKNDVMSKFRSRVYEDLHSNIVKYFPIEEVGPRIASLTYMLQEANIISFEYNESLTMRKLLNSNVLEVFEDQ